MNDVVIRLRPARDGDHAEVIGKVDDWWGGRRMAPMLPKLFFIHFPDTTVVAEADDGSVAGFLCGFQSMADHDVAYIHFVGVDPAARGRQVGRAMYEWFFERARSLGCGRVECVTSPANTGSRAFHAAMGFEESLVEDYDGPGESRMRMWKDLTS